MIRREQLQRIHVALDTTNGNVKQAARILGLSKESLRTIIDQNPELASYKLNAEPPSEIEASSKDNTASVVRAMSKDDEEKLAAARRIEGGLEAALAAMGISDKSVKAAVASVQFGKNHFLAMRSLASGTLAEVIVSLKEDFHAVRQEIEEADKNDPEMQKLLREDKSRIVGHILQAAQNVNTMAKDAAIIQARMQELSRKKSATKGRPGFAPMKQAVVETVPAQEVPSQPQGAPSA